MVGSNSTSSIPSSHSKMFLVSDFKEWISSESCYCPGSVHYDWSAHSDDQPDERGDYDQHHSESACRMTRLEEVYSPH